MTAEEAIEKAFINEKEKSEIKKVIETHGSEKVKFWLTEDRIKDSRATKIVSFEIKPSALEMDIINYNLSII